MGVRGASMVLPCGSHGESMGLCLHAAVVARNNKETTPATGED